MIPFSRFFPIFSPFPYSSHYLSTCFPIISRWVSYMSPSSVLIFSFLLIYQSWVVLPKTAAVHRKSLLDSRCAFFSFSYFHHSFLFPVFPVPWYFLTFWSCSIFGSWYLSWIYLFVSRLFLKHYCLLFAHFSFTGSIFCSFFPVCYLWIFLLFLHFLIPLLLTCAHFLYFPYYSHLPFYQLDNRALRVPA